MNHFNAKTKRRLVHMATAIIGVACSALLAAPAQSADGSTMAKTGTQYKAHADMQAVF